jgi:hypothetical protein
LSEKTAGIPGGFFSSLAGTGFEPATFHDNPIDKKKN